MEIHTGLLTYFELPILNNLLVSICSWKHPVHPALDRMHAGVTPRELDNKKIYYYINLYAKCCCAISLLVLGSILYYPH